MFFFGKKQDRLQGEAGFGGSFRDCDHQQKEENIGGQNYILRENENSGFCPRARETPHVR